MLVGGHGSRDHKIAFRLVREKPPPKTKLQEHKIRKGTFEGLVPIVEL